MKRTHTGWTPEEDQMLLHAVRAKKKERASLQSAFESVAKMTGRRPNSVRNRYYTQRKGHDSEPLFVPFTEEETEDLVRQVLLARAEGLSVRACTLRLAEGDTRRMLRYQNKYRAILKGSPERIRSIRDSLAAEGYPTPDPYHVDPGRPRVGRPPKGAIPAAAIRRLLDALYDSLLALSKGEEVS